MPRRAVQLGLQLLPLLPCSSRPAQQAQRERSAARRTRVVHGRGAVLALQVHVAPVLQENRHHLGVPAQRGCRRAGRRGAHFGTGGRPGQGLRQAGALGRSGARSQAGLQRRRHAGAGMRSRRQAAACQGPGGRPADLPACSGVQPEWVSPSASAPASNSSDTASAKPLFAAMYLQAGEWIATHPQCLPRTCPSSHTTLRHPHPSSAPRKARMASNHPCCKPHYIASP